MASLYAKCAEPKTIRPRFLAVPVATAPTDVKSEEGVAMHSVQDPSEDAQ